MKAIALTITLGVLGFAVLYFALIVGEALSLTSFVTGWRARTQISLTLLAAIIYLFIATPIAYLVGRGLVRWAPNLGHGAIGIAALLFTGTVIVLQLGLYDSSIVGRSIVKVVFSVAPLLWVLYQSHRKKTA